MVEIDTDYRNSISQLTISDPSVSSECALSCIGDTCLLNRRKIGLLCSIRCPGDIILKTLDLMQELRTMEVCVVSGFHSPMEQECLKVLLRGSCGVLLCYARCLPKRIPHEYEEAAASGRMLLLSPFSESQDHATRGTSRLRNRLVAALSDAILVPYAAPGGITEGILREASGSGKSILTFAADGFGMDEKAMIVTEAATFLQDLSQVDISMPVKYQMVQSADKHAE